jgi:hypothetical protein
MAVSDYIGRGPDSIVVPRWLVETTYEIIETVKLMDDAPVIVDRVEFHESGRITLIFKERDRD